MQDGRFGIDAAWKPYLAYAPLAPGSSDDELDEFLAREEEAACAMCPAQPQPFAIPLPLRQAR
jgi:hypothetical protein